MCGTLKGCDAWFNGGGLSATFGIGKDGDIHQYVELEDIAWANGSVANPDPSIAHLYTGHNPNVVTWSIEHEGWPSDRWTETMYQADLALKRYLLNLKPGLTIVGHFQFDSVNRNNCPGPHWPLTRLLFDLTEEEYMKPPLYRIEHREEVYYLAGGKLIHIPNQAAFLTAGYKPEDVTVLPASNAIWKLPVEYSNVPPAMM